MGRSALKDKAIGGFFWTLAEKFGAQGVSFVVSIILARLLAPNDYGIVALVTIFTSISNVLVKSGMGSALIQKKEADSLDFSTVFYFNVVTSVLLYGVMFFLAPYIAGFYQQPELTSVLRVCSLSLILNGINNVQQAYVSKHLEFKKFFVSTAIGTVISAVVGILMAYAGCGVWALVTQQLLNQVMDTAILYYTISWKPKMQFSFDRLRKMYSFGWKLLVTELIATIYSDIHALIIGKKYSAEQLAYYNKGCSFPKLVVRNLDNSIQSVTFPLLSNTQDDKERFAYIMRRACTLSFYFVCPMMIGMICVAEPMVRILLTDKWIEAVPYLQLYCISYLLRPIDTTNMQTMYALGRSDVTLKLDILKKIYGISFTIIAVFLFDSAIAICVSVVICTFLNVLVNMIAVSKLTGIRVFTQIKSISGILSVSLLMGCVCVFLGKVLSGIPAVYALIIQIVTGGITYVIFSKLFKLDSFNYVLNYCMDFIKKRKSK